MTTESSREDLLKDVSVLICVFGALAFVLNLFVIYQILRKGICKVHPAKLYFLSLAIADLLFGFVCLVSSLFILEIIKIQTGQTSFPDVIIIFFVISALTFLSSLFHILLITLDRFIATTFPIHHKIHFTRKKVIVSIVISWIISSCVISTEHWQNYPIMDWFIAIVEATGFLMILITYIHIAKVATRRRNALKKRKREEIGTQRNDKGINTTYLSIVITSSFMFCILTNCTCIIASLLEYNELPYWLEYASMMLLVVNAAINPVIYSLVEYFNGRRSGGSKCITCNCCCCGIEIIEVYIKGKQEDQRDKLECFVLENIQTCG